MAAPAMKVTARSAATIGVPGRRVPTLASHAIINSAAASTGPRGMPCTKPPAPFGSRKYASQISKRWKVYDILTAHVVFPCDRLGHHRDLSRGDGRHWRLLFAPPNQPRSLPARGSQHGLAAGRPVADGRAQQRHGLSDAALVDDPLRYRARGRHRIVAAAVSVCRARGISVLPPPRLLLGLRISRGPLRSQRARARRRDLSILAAWLDGDGDVRTESCHQRREQ